MLFNIISIFTNNSYYHINKIIVTKGDANY